MKEVTAAVAINQMALTAKLEKADKRWRQYNGAFENCLVTPRELADQIRSGHAYTSWHEPHYRHSQNWLKSQFIAVDLDTGDSRSSFDSILSKPLVVAYGTLVHSTFSHRPEAPRSRVIFFLDRPIEDPEGYRAACTFMTKCMGADEACTDPSRGFFGAMNCMCEEIGSVLPLDVMRKMYRTFHDKIPKRKPQSPAQPASPLNLDERYARIAQALAFIPKWGIDYDDWISVLAAIKNELGDAGFNLAVSWGSEEEGDVAHAWKHFRREGGKLARMGTIIRLASLHGFDARVKQLSSPAANPVVGRGNKEAATPETSRPHITPSN